MFKAVLFDLDGVVTDTAEYHYLAWKELANDLGFTIDRDFNETLKGVSREESLRRVLEKGGLEGSFSPEELEGLAAKKNANYVEMIQGVSPDDVYPGILALLKELKLTDIRVGLASASKNGPFLIKQLQLSDYFDVIIDPSIIKQGKPAPDIFLAAAEGLGVSITSSIAIEDATAGIAAIQAAGALPIGVGAASVLGDAIAIVPETSQLSLDYLISVWNKNKRL